MDYKFHGLQNPLEVTFAVSGNKEMNKLKEKKMFDVYVHMRIIDFYVFKRHLIKPGESVRILRRALEGYTNQIS